MTTATSTNSNTTKSTSTPLYDVVNLSKRYRMGRIELPVLRGVNLSVHAGEFLAIEGRSGSGKSTLLHLMGGLDTPDAGSLVFDGRDIGRVGHRVRGRIRNREIGFVFQFYHLLPELNVLENTTLSTNVDGWLAGHLKRRSQTRSRAEELLDKVGLRDRLRHRPAELSGGERQRVAIARALMNRPRLLLADEPTGNLDSQTGRQIMDVIEDLHRRESLTVVMVTHDRTLAKEADRVLVLRDGLLVQE